MVFHTIDDVNIFLSSYYENSPLYNKPEPIKEQGYDAVRCIYFKEFVKNVACTYSVVIPVHNQESIIRQNLLSVINCTKGFYEIIIILDACDDNTKDVVLNCFENLETALDLIRVIICESSDVPLFETVCDNIGFRIGSGKWLLEIQADMFMTEIGYNLALVRPFLLYDDVIAVSGRCSHSLDEKQYVGKFADLIIKSVLELGLDSNKFYVNEVCNRGPLLLCKEKVHLMGYLDETNFYLEYSEIDLMLRAYETKKWICGYVPIDFNSPLHDGSTRKERDAINNYILNVRKNRGNGGLVKTYLGRGIFRPGYILPL